MYRYPATVDASRFWAVLIGIDAYEGRPLHGCISDTSLMKKFLIDDLGVLKERIQCLLGSHDSIPDNPLTPSHANIVNTLCSLIHNDEIQLGDNIIIYYAGHGSSYQYCCHASSFDCGPSGSGIRTTPITAHTSLTDMLRAADERDYQLVKETVGKDKCSGVFTSTLVRVLRSDAWKKGTTYIGLTELLNESYSQTPVVARDYKDEQLWYQG
ncbi:hypothetical protein IW262DRAFT_1528423 [Armillaria fumosa]|nr:hypothetical protein IW262DRAFT_1528423 [Armillaria fumosa]